MSRMAKVQEGWFEVGKQKITSFFESFDLSYESLKKMALYGGIGFACGFILKRYGITLIVAALLTICVMYGLESTNFITVHSDKLKLYLGFAHKATLADVTTLYWSWVTNNIPLSISVGVGFIAGYKIG